MVTVIKAEHYSNNFSWARLGVHKDIIYAEILVLNTTAALKQDLKLASSSNRMQRNRKNVRIIVVGALLR